MARMTSWHAGVPSVRVRLGCGGSMHHATWSAGDLVLEDHDAEAERALVGMGGEQPRCLELIDAWEWAVGAADDEVELVGDVGVWELVSTEETRVLSTLPGHLTHALRAASLRLAGPRTGTMSQYMRQKARLGVLRALPDALRHILVLELLRRREAQLWEDRHRSRFAEMDSTLRSAVVPSVRNSLDHAGRGLGSRLSVAVGPVPPSTTGRVTVHGSRVEVWLPFSWLVDVQARGLADLPDIFVTEVAWCGGDGTRAGVAGFDWVREHGSIRPVRVEAEAVRTASGWEVVG